MSVSPVVNPARGTHLKYGTGSAPIVYADFGQVVSIDGPGQEVGTRETTHLTSGQWKTFAPTLSDGGEVSGQLLFDPKSDGHVFLQGLINSPPAAPGPFQILFADATNGPSTASFLGILTKFAPTGIEVEANLEADFTLKISGAVTFT